ncbi:MAG: hypothetical protein GX022_00835 [Clostridiaceae bacterium]|nr:hypothetical protein [Clostridiaceae bacterium]
MMKVNGIYRTSLILLLGIISVLFIVSCGTETTILNTRSGNEADNISSKDQLLSAYKNNSSIVMIEEYTSPLKKELEGLRYVLSPYLSDENDLFIGYDNREYIENYFLNPDTSNLSMSAADWERTIRILFAFDDKDFSFVKTNITDYIFEDKITREYALAGLMNLLAIRYSVSLEPDDEDTKKSFVITDLDRIGEENKALVSKAFRLGFTDYSVDKSRSFRPDDFLNRGEAISMFYRIFTNLGLPISKQDEPDADANIQEDKDTLNQTHKAYSIEDILSEYGDYRESLKKSKKKADKTKLEMLNRAERILNIDYDSDNSNVNMDINTWIYILTEVFETDSQQIKSSVIYGKDKTLTYDIVAISIFDFQNLTGNNTGNVSEEELTAAREAIPQFETAKDIDSFARMYSSGMLEGICKIPGFTPKRPVNYSEALLLIMRIVKGLSI